MDKVTGISVDHSLFIRTAQKGWELGLNVIPCRQDKRPEGYWEDFQHRMATLTEFEERFNIHRYGIGIVPGKVSLMLEIIDIDQKYCLTGNLTHDYFKLINDTDPDLFNSLYIVKSPSGGFHLYYRCQEIEGNQKLAQRPATDDELRENPKAKVRVLIETRGEGGFIVCPPTPGYEPWQKNEIPTISIDQRNFLLNTARSFNEIYEETKTVKQPYTRESPFDVTPWDDYDQRGDILDLLAAHSWKEDCKSGVRVYFTRPGKDKGVSADYHLDKKLFKVWSTSVSDFEAEKAYSHTAVYALLECGGDFQKAAAELESKGYGKRRAETSQRNIAPSNGIDKNHPGDDYDKLFQSTILDQEKDYPLPVAVVSLKHNDDIYPMLTLKSFSLFQGKQKSKKTITLALMIAAYLRHTLSNEPVDFVGHDVGTVLWVDCEQGESYAARTMKLVLKLAGLDRSDRIVYCDFRDHGPRDRMKLIEAGIRNTPGVQLVIIDGIVDLMDDFMDAAEGHGVITRLLTLCSIHNIHICGVLHQNKADKNARAHVGSIGSQKCEIEISTEVDSSDTARSIISCVNSRGLPFQHFAVRWDKGALPCIDMSYEHGTASKTEVKAGKDFERQKEIAQKVFKPFAALTHTEAQEAIMKVTERGESTATRMIKNLRGWGIIVQGGDKLYRIAT